VKKAANPLSKNTDTPPIIHLQRTYLEDVKPPGVVSPRLHNETKLFIADCLLGLNSSGLVGRICGQGYVGVWGLRVALKLQAPYHYRTRIAINSLIKSLSSLYGLSVSCIVYFGIFRRFDFVRSISVMEIVTFHPEDESDPEVNNNLSLE
jgi:hypothetical protein